MKAPILLCVLLRNMATGDGVPLLKMKDHLEERVEQASWPVSPSAPAGAGRQ